MFNEQDGIQEFCRLLRSTLDEMRIHYEVILVDDGSTDETVSNATDTDWSSLTLLQLTTNVGHQKALEAGIFAAKGDYVVTLDSDGQHPVELIPTMLKLAQGNEVDIVYGLREERTEEPLRVRLPAQTYYRMISWLTDIQIENSQADFRLISRRVIDEIRMVRGDKVLRLLIPSLGFPSTSIRYTAQPRISGSSRFGISRQVSLATESVLSFSPKPLRWVAAIGLLTAAGSLFWLVTVVITWWNKGTVAGWASVMAAVLFVGGAALLALSLIGAYLARIFEILRNSPRYVIGRSFTSDEGS